MGGLSEVFCNAEEDFKSLPEQGFELHWGRVDWHGHDDGCTRLTLTSTYVVEVRAGSLQPSGRGWLDDGGEAVLQFNGLSTL